MMNLLKLFFAVVTAHLAVIGILFFLPGCQTMEEGTPNTSTDTSSYVEDDSQGDMTYTSINDHVESASNLRRPPTRPTWNLENTHAQATLADSGDSEVLEPVSPEFDLPPVSESVGTSYTVQKGDTLWGLSRRYNVSVNAIASASGIRAKTPLKVGQTLTIPTSSAATQPSVSKEEGTYTVRSGDTLSAIAARNGTTVAGLKQANGLSRSTIRVGQKLVLPGATSAPIEQGVGHAAPVVPQIQGDAYTVVRGDTLSGIAKRTGVSVSDLMAINGINDPTHLQVGQTLALKGASTSSQPAATSVETPSDAVFDSAEDVPVVETVVVDVVQEEEEYSDDFGDDSIFDAADEVSVVPVDETNS